MNRNREKNSITAVAESQTRLERPFSIYLGIVAFYGVLLTILLASIPYGTVSPFYELLVVVLICVFAGFRLIENLFTGSFRISEPVLLAPLVGVLCVALVQTIQWPGTVSSVTFDPYETKAFILVFGGLLLTAEVLSRYACEPGRRRHLVGLVIIVGVGAALFGLLRPVFFDGIFVSLAKYTEATQGYAQFINRNHFAVMMEMTLGLLLGLLLKGGLPEKLKLLVWILSGIVSVALINANSRGGLMSLAALSVFATLVHLITKDWPVRRFQNDQIVLRRRLGGIARRVITGIGICGFVLASVVVMIVFVGGDKVVSRIERTKNELEMADGGGVNRMAIWTSTIELIKQHPVGGVGFGAYSAAITGFDDSAGKFALQQAHNEYLEILANGGIVGLVLFATFGVMLVLRVLINLRSGDKFTRASCFGAAVGIFGVLIHSFVDFGLHVMVNGLVFASLIVIATVNDSSAGLRPGLGVARI